MEDRKSALVIGGTGFIGRRLVRNLVEQGLDVTIASRGKAENPFGSKVRAIVLDRFSQTGLSEAITDDMYFDILFDQVGFGPDDMKASISSLEGKIGHYVYTSSMSVYDDMMNRMDESDFEPTNYEMKNGGIGNLGYSEGKRSAEAYLFRHSGVPAVAARFPIVVGPDDVTGRFQFHVERIMDGREIVVPEPCGRMNFVWVEDAGRFLAWAGLNGISGTYNAASAEGLNAVEVAQMIGKTLGKTPKIAREGRKEDRSPYYIEADRTESTSKVEKAGFAFTATAKWLPEVAKLAAETKGVQHNSMDYLRERMKSDR